jgi:glucose/arabinose dehydrogenase
LVAAIADQAVADLVPAGTQAQRIATGFSNPIFADAPAGDTGRLFVAEQGSGTSALIRILDLTTNTINPTPFLTVTDIVAGGEQGLLGMAFHPNYASNGRFFVNVTAPGGAFGSGVTQIREYVAVGDPLTASTAVPAPVPILLSFDQPQTNHNGGWIGFSPRAGDAGNLYIASGDGGSANDEGTGHVEPGGNAQNTSSLLGKVLRINVETDAFPSDAARNYSIPSGTDGNPFADGVDGAPEVFAIGLRNPFRASFDSTEGHMYIGDVGQGAREEVDFQSADRPGGGDNYQWRLREGSIETEGDVGGEAPPDSTGPIDDYDRTIGTTITGGYVYRGADIPGLDGTYLYADFGSGRIFALRHDGTAVTAPREDVTSILAPGGPLVISNPASFAEDALGELYILDYADGEIYRITAIPEPSPLLFGALATLVALVALVVRRLRPSAG